MKRQRQAEILSIIRTKEIENQETLLSELRSRGFSVTQATISRDINEMGLEKVNSDGISVYAPKQLARAARFESLFGQSVINIDYAMNTVVIKCHSGLANAACAALDTMSLPSVVGTIAGDDTIFILTRSERDAVELVKRLREI